MSDAATRLPNHPPRLVLLRLVWCGFLLWCGLGPWGADEPPVLMWGMAVFGALGIPWALLVWWRGFIAVTPSALRWCRPRIWAPFAAARELPRAALRQVVVVRRGGRMRTAVLAVETADGTRETLSAMEASVFRFEVDELGQRLAGLLGLPLIEDGA